MTYKVPILCEEIKVVEYEILANAKDTNELHKLLTETDKDEIFIRFNIVNEQIIETLETYKCNLPNKEDYKYFEKYGDSDE